MTRGEIRTLIRKHLGETTASFWSDANLNTWIDDAGHDIAFETKSIRTTQTWTTQTDTQEYTLSTVLTNPIAVIECSLNIGPSTSGETPVKTDQWVKMRYVTREELNAVTPGWRQAASGIASQYYWDREEDIIGFNVPLGGNAVGTDFAECVYAKDYTELTLDSSSPALPTYLHEAMVWHVVANGYGHRGYGDKANDAWTKYNAKIRRYYVEKHREKEDEEIIMKPERNIW